MWREALRGGHPRSMMERDEQLCHLMSPTNDNTSSDDRGEEKEGAREGVKTSRASPASRLLAFNVGRAASSAEEKLTFLTAAVLIRSLSPSSSSPSLSDLIRACRRRRRHRWLGIKI